MIRRRTERGTAILITMMIIVALLGGGAVLVGIQMASTRSTEITRSNMTALYCAEAGLNASTTTPNAAFVVTVRTGTSASVSLPGPGVNPAGGHHRPTHY